MSSYKFKMILLGESGSGKTSLFNRIIHGTFERSQEGNTNDRTMDREPSLSSGRYKNRTKEVRVSGNRTVNVAVFDTGGEERVNFMTLHYYENAQIVCLVYAVDSIASLTSLNAWVEDARDYLALKTQHSIAKPVYALVGVKADIPLGEREVNSAHVERAAKHFDVPQDCCFEVSNTTGDGIREMVQCLAQKAYDLHTLSISRELQDYSSIKTTPLEFPEEPVYRSKRWLCSCLCCCTTRRCDYENINST